MASLTSWFDSPLDNEYIEVSKTSIDFVTLEVDRQKYITSFGLPENLQIKQLYKGMIQFQKYNNYINKFELATCIAEKFDFQTIDIDANRNQFLSNIFVSALSWYLKYQSIEYSYTENLRIAYFGEQPVWSYPPGEEWWKRGVKLKERTTACLFNSSEVHPVIRLFIKEVEKWIHSFMKVIEVFNIYGKPGIHNIISWSWNWDSSTYALKEQWPYIHSIQNPDFELEITLQNRKLVHATSVKNFVSMLYNSTDDKILLQPKKSPGQYTHPALAWCGVKLTSEENQQIQTYQTIYQTYYPTDSLNRYGSIVLTFPWNNDKQTRTGHILGTRKYIKEFSQVILIPAQSSAEIDHYMIEARGVKRLNKIELDDYKWKLQYGAYEWTHPELAFVEHLAIPLNDLSISFSDHACNTAKKKFCLDCRDSGSITKSEARYKFATMLNQNFNLKQFVLDKLEHAYTEQDLVKDLKQI